MQSPKVIEIRRGSAHGAAIAPIAAAAAWSVRHDEGQRWNSAS
jgi:hypothetical protein